MKKRRQTKFSLRFEHEGVKYHFDRTDIAMIKKLYALDEVPPLDFIPYTTAFERMYARWHEACHQHVPKHVLWLALVKLRKNKEFGFPTGKRLSKRRGVCVPSH